jgi:hypothetical protein
LLAAVSRLEHEGWIVKLGERLQEDAAFRADVDADHEAYAAERWSTLRPADQAEVIRRGLEVEFQERGIGGIRNRTGLKCLHLHYAHHLARGSAVGRELDKLGVLHACAAPARG